MIPYKIISSYKKDVFLTMQQFENSLPNIFQNKHKKVCLNKNSCSDPKLDTCVNYEILSFYMPAETRIQDRCFMEFHQLQEVILKCTRQLLKFNLISVYMT